MRLIGMSIIVGICAGLSAALFLFLLSGASGFLLEHLWLVWLLPTAGLLIGWLFSRYGQDVERGAGLIFEEIHDPKNNIPVKMAPLILIGTLITHLFGGSAGREGTAVQMSGSLADEVARRFRATSAERKAALIAGLGAGFGAAIGAPWAGVVFGMEVVYAGRLKLSVWLECLIASFVGFYLTEILQAPHSLFPSFIIADYSLRNVGGVLAAGVVFGLTARAFIFLTHQVESVFRRLISIPMWRPFVGGLLLAVFFQIEGSSRYVGLGISYIQNAFVDGAGFEQPFLKALATSVTIGSGFKGGEFVPLVYIGTTLGAWLSSLIPISLQLLAGMGFGAVFAGASNAPIACSLMVAEIFGWHLAPFALVACFASYAVSGTRGIYKSQRFEHKHWMARALVRNFKK